MLNYKDYFLLYESAGPNKHLTHLEELILTDKMMPVSPKPPTVRSKSFLFFFFEEVIIFPCKFNNFISYSVLVLYELLPGNCLVIVPSVNRTPERA